MSKKISHKKVTSNKDSKVLFSPFLSDNTKHNVDKNILKEIVSHYKNFTIGECQKLSHITDTLGNKFKLPIAYTLYKKNEPMVSGEEKLTILALQDSLKGTLKKSQISLYIKLGTDIHNGNSDMVNKYLAKGITIYKPNSHAVTGKISLPSIDKVKEKITTLYKSKDNVALMDIVKFSNDLYTKLSKELHGKAQSKVTTIKAIPTKDGRNKTITVK